MGIRGRTYFLGAQKDKYPGGCEVDRMRQKGERHQKHLKFGTSAFLPALAVDISEENARQGVSAAGQVPDQLSQAIKRGRHHVVEN
jgi:hypothetical protein